MIISSLVLASVLLVYNPQKVEKISKCGGQVVSSSWQYKPEKLPKKLFRLATKLQVKLVKVIILTKGY